MRQASEIELMTLEARLDRIQCLLRKGKSETAYKESRIALGEIRSILEYHKTARQKTLHFWQPRPTWKKHMAKFRGTK